MTKTFDKFHKYSSVHVYLNMPHSQHAMDMRLTHVAKTLNKDTHEVRIYTCGSDFQKSEALRELPYGVIDGKPKSNENFFTEIIGEKLED